MKTMKYGVRFTDIQSHIHVVWTDDEEAAEECARILSMSMRKVRMKHMSTGHGKEFQNGVMTYLILPNTEFQE